MTTQKNDKEPNQNLYSMAISTADLINSRLGAIKDELFTAKGLDPNSADFEKEFVGQLYEDEMLIKDMSFEAEEALLKQDGYSEMSLQDFQGAVSKRVTAAILTILDQGLDKELDEEVKTQKIKKVMEVLSSPDLPDWAQDLKPNDDLSEGWSQDLANIKAKVEGLYPEKPVEPVCKGEQREQTLQKIEDANIYAEILVYDLIGIDVNAAKIGLNPDSPDFKKEFVSRLFANPRLIKNMIFEVAEALSIKDSYGEMSLQDFQDEVSQRVTAAIWAILDISNETKTEREKVESAVEILASPDLPKWVQDLKPNDDLSEGWSQNLDKIKEEVGKFYPEKPVEPVYQGVESEKILQKIEDAQKILQEAGHLELSEFLLSKVKDDRKIEALEANLQAAKQSGRKALYEHLLDNAKDYEQRKALEMNLVPIQKHIIKGEESEFKTLLDEGADLKVKDKNGNNLAHLAANSANTEFILSALQQKDPGLLLAKNRDGKTALDILEEKGKIKLARDFYFALETSREKFREKYPLLKELPKPKRKAKEYISIDDLTYREQMEARIIQKHSKHKLKPIKISEKNRVIQDEKGNSALHLASTKGDLKAVEFLLEQGVNLDHENKYGVRAHNALEYHLLDSKSDKSTSHDARSTVLDIASKDDNLDQVKILTKIMRAKGLSSKEIFKNPITSNNKEIEQYLTKYKTFLETIEGLKTPIAPKKSPAKTKVKAPEKFKDLHEAIAKGTMEDVRELIANGADLNKLDSIGQTPLHKAAKTKRRKLVELLLKNGADATIEDQLGYTPLALAKERYDSLFKQYVSDPKISRSLGKEGLIQALIPIRKSGKIIALLQQETGAIEVTASKKIYLTNWINIWRAIKESRNDKAKEVAKYKKQSLENFKASLEKAQKTGKYDEVAKFPAETLNEFKIPRVIRHKIQEAKDELDKQFKKEWQKHNKGITKNNRTNFLDGDTEYYLGSGPMSGGTNKNKADPSVLRFNAKLSQLSSSDKSTSAPMQLVEQNLTKEEQTEWDKIEQESYDLVIKKKNSGGSKGKKLKKEAKKVTKDVSNYLHAKLEESKDLPEDQKKIRRETDFLVTTNKKRKVLRITNEDGSLKAAYKGAKVFMWRYDENHKKIRNSGKNSEEVYEVDWVQFDMEGKVVGGNVGMPPEHSSLQYEFIKEIQDPKIAIKQIELKAAQIGRSVSDSISTSPKASSSKEDESLTTKKEETIQAFAKKLATNALEQGKQEVKKDTKNPETQSRTSTVSNTKLQSRS